MKNLLLLICILFLISCSKKKIENRIVGTWDIKEITYEEAQDGTIQKSTVLSTNQGTAIFNEDGTGSFKDHEDINGRYSQDTIIQNTSFTWVSGKNKITTYYTNNDVIPYEVITKKKDDFKIRLWGITLGQGDERYSDISLSKVN